MLLKSFYYLKQYQFQYNPYQKITSHSFKNGNSNIHFESHETQNSPSHGEKNKKQAENFIIYDFKTYYKTVVIQQGGAVIKKKNQFIDQ